MRSEKPFITKSTKTGICQQRHMVTGEHSLNGSFFHCSLKPSQPSRGQEASSFRDSVLCVWRHMQRQTWRPRSLLGTCCFRLGSSLTHQAANPSAPEPPLPPRVCSSGSWLPSSDAASLSPSNPAALRAFSFHPFPVLGTPRCPGHHGAPRGQHHEASAEEIRSSNQPTCPQALFIHKRAMGPRQV